MANYQFMDNVKYVVVPYHLIGVETKSKNQCFIAELVSNELKSKLDVIVTRNGNDSDIIREVNQLIPFNNRVDFVFSIPYNDVYICSWDSIVDIYQNETHSKNTFNDYKMINDKELVLYRNPPELPLESFYCVNNEALYNKLSDILVTVKSFDSSKKFLVYIHELGILKCTDNPTTYASVEYMPAYIDWAIENLE